MTTDQVFQAFGGRDAVMEITGQSRNTVNHWRTTGIPWRHWPALKRAAAKRKIPGITDDALESTRSKPTRSNRADCAA
jgi:hypothetical protein